MTWQDVPDSELLSLRDRQVVRVNDSMRFAATAAEVAEVEFQVLSRMDSELIRRLVSRYEVETFDPIERAREKQASREADAAAIKSGEKTAEQVKRENGSFAFPRSQVRLGPEPLGRSVPATPPLPRYQDLVGPRDSREFNERCPICHCPVVREADHYDRSTYNYRCDTKYRSGK